MRKPKLSGAARRRIARERAREILIAQGARVEAELIPRGQKATLETLESPAGCRREVNRLILEAQAGRLHVDDVTKFVYALDKSAGMRRMELEIAQRDELIAELRRRNELLTLNAGALPSLAPALPAEPLGDAVEDGGEVQP